MRSGEGGVWGVVICEPLAGLDGVRGHVLPVQKPFSVRGSGWSLVPTVLPGQDEGGGNGCCPAPQLVVSLPSSPASREPAQLPS